jgi:hypothetical protein
MICACGASTRMFLSAWVIITPDAAMSSENCWA